MEFARLGHLFVTVFLYNFATFMVIPSITDVTMNALCPGQDECSLAIYLSGFQQAITGLGSLVMMPVVGNLSDVYGRKALLTLPMSLGIVPLAILAYRRTENYFYGYYLIKLLTAMFCEGSVLCLSLAYLADNISETRRASAFGMLAGIGSAAFVCGTLTARLISTSSTFQVSTFVSVFAIVYMRTFLVDSRCQIDETSPLLANTKEVEDGDSCRKIGVGKKIPSVKDMVQLLSSSLTFTQAAVVAFFSSLAEGGLHASMMYFLKAQFHFSKNQFADLMLIAGLASSISQLLLMPMLAPALDEVKLLRIGLFAACVHMFLYSISWASWVPYFASSFCIVSVFAHPCIRSIASKQLSPEEERVKDAYLACVLLPTLYLP
ncbi:hypothetical protein AQUCO_03500101v1 [Aquilegia coerulea]|uniref:Major facilitator superfamily (MFS) profile domain-containing protein n=1 Tax=Aquilegia coerulea TaxID=218851 RepID=A0A2G5CW60_AQUCA|nr:hypothetical protein AQUCO_03500101v1 [Aquilegia coerulea]